MGTSSEPPGKASSTTVCRGAESCGSKIETNPTLYVIMPTVQRSQSQALPVIRCGTTWAGKRWWNGKPNPVTLVAIVRGYNAVKAGVMFPLWRLISRKSPQPVVIISVLITRCW